MEWKESMRNKGQVHIYTGAGKGKTTAALGLALRAAGAGLRVCFVQFLKGRPTSEIALLEKLPGLALMRFGRPGFIYGRPTARDRALARAGWSAVRAALASGEFDVVVADEICAAVNLELVSETEVLEGLRLRSGRVEAVLTGRGATARMRRAADLVTEMREKKHYFKKGIKARKGIEY